MKPRLVKIEGIKRYRTADVSSARRQLPLDGRQSEMEIRHYKFKRISLDADKCFGKPCIRGLRMPVASILSYLASGMTLDEMLREWPELEREDIYEALGYAAWAMEERVVLSQEAAAK